MPPPERFVHPALFYQGREQYLASTVPFLEQGLAGAQPCAVATPPAQLEWIRRALGVAADRVVLIDMTDAGRNPGRIIPQVLRAFADAHPGGPVRIIGEPIWAGRSALEYPACVQHEALINAAFTGRDATVLCPYDAAALDEHVLSDARTTHPLLIDESGEHRSALYDPWATVARYNTLPPAPPHAASHRFGRDSLPQARAFAVARARAHGMDHTALPDLELAVGELATNAVIHGAGAGTLRIWATNDQVVFEVHDDGSLTDPLAGRRPATPGEPHGRGLLLVNQLAALVRVQAGGDSGTTIRAYLDQRCREDHTDGG